MEGEARQARHHRGLVIALVAALVVALSLGTAIAHKARYATSVNLRIKEIDPATSQYSGKVGSAVARCAHFRSVTITSTAGLSVQTTSNINGDYSVLGAKQVQGIDVTATVTRRVLRKTRRHKHVCVGAAATHKAPK